MIKSIVIVASFLIAHNTWADESSYAITYSHSELTTPAGVVAVHQRLVAAALDYCPGYLQMKSHAAVDACVDGVVEDLVKKINQPSLTAYTEDPETFNKQKTQLIAAKDE